MVADAIDQRDCLRSEVARRQAYRTAGRWPAGGAAADRNRDCKALLAVDVEQRGHYGYDGRGCKDCGYVDGCAACTDAGMSSMRRYPASRLH